MVSDDQVLFEPGDAIFDAGGRLEAVVAEPIRASDWPEAHQLIGVSGPVTRETPISEAFLAAAAARRRGIAGSARNG